MKQAGWKTHPKFLTCALIAQQLHVTGHIGHTRMSADTKAHNSGYEHRDVYGCLAQRIVKHNDSKQM